MLILSGEADCVVSCLVWLPTKLCNSQTTAKHSSSLVSIPLTVVFRNNMFNKIIALWVRETTVSHST